MNIEIVGLEELDTFGAIEAEAGAYPGDEPFIESLPEHFVEATMVGAVILGATVYVAYKLRQMHDQEMVARRQRYEERKRQSSTQIRRVRRRTSRTGTGQHMTGQDLGEQAE